MSETTPELSADAVAAVPEIAEFLRRDSKNRRGKAVKQALWVAADVLETAAEKQGKESAVSEMESKVDKEDLPW